MKSAEPSLFDYGLDAAQEERARRLHKESIIVDMLLLGPVGAPAYTEDMIKQITEEYQKDYDRWRSVFMERSLPGELAARGEFPAFKEWWDVSGITAGNQQLPLYSLENTMRNLAVLGLQFENLDWFIKTTSADDIRRAKAEDKHAVFLGTQETVWLGKDLDNLDMLHKYGLKAVQLTYNTLNFVGAGCTERTDAGVSMFGVALIERMNELGIIVDTGHCGHQTTLDACKISSLPVIASHTCAQGVYYHARGKSDEEIEAIAKTGGVVGVLVIAFFLSDAAEVTMEHYLDHIDYIVKLVGHEHVGIGTDLPVDPTVPAWSSSPKVVEKLRMMSGFRPEDKVPEERPFPKVKGFSDCRQFINITRGLVSRGYSDDEIRDILGGNWLRVMEAVWK